MAGSIPGFLWQSDSSESTPVCTPPRARSLYGGSINAIQVYTLLCAYLTVHFGIGSVTQHHPTAFGVSMYVHKPYCGLTVH